MKKLKKRSYYKNKLDKVFGDYIKKRDNYRCVQCGTTSQPTAGHLITRAWESTRWDELNVFCQCASENLIHEHDPHRFIQWYINKFGLEAYEKLYQKARDHSVHYSRTDLIELIEIYKNKLNNF